MNDTTPKVTGIGGIFFRYKNPKETREWYGKKTQGKRCDHSGQYRGI